MTIAATFVTAEGVVLAADSTTTTVTRTAQGAGGLLETRSHIDHAQKLFELGAESTIGVVTWGLATVEGTSIRTLLAEFDDEMRKSPPKDFAELAAKWASHFWTYYSAQPAVMQHVLRVNAGQLTGPEREASKAMLQSGFGFGGRYASRQPQAFEVKFDPEATVPPQPTSIQVGQAQFWGVPNIVNRLMLGYDQDLVPLLMASGKWSGTEAELQTALRQKALGVASGLAIRDAIDVLYTLLSTTVRVIRFTGLPPVCGGAIEIAVVTTDRAFRWVRHKPLDSALG